MSEINKNITPLGFNIGTSIYPLGFTGDLIISTGTTIKNIYVGSSPVLSLYYYDGSIVQNIVQKVYYGSTLVWEI